MAYTIPTTAQTRDRIITDIESTINQTVPLLPKSFIFVLATALAGAYTLLYKFGLWIYQQIFPQTADGVALELIGTSVGVTYKGAIQAVITGQDTGVDGVIVPAGTRYISDTQIVYVTQTTEQVAGGVVILTLLALTAGAVGNLAVNDTVNIEEDINDLDGTLTVTALTVEGEDAEDIEDYRPRVLERLARRPQGGAQIDYITWAKEVPGITRAFAFLIAPGFVGVYPLQDNDIVTRIPSTEKLEEVAAYINDPARKPFTASVLVTAMVEIEFTVTISSLSPDTASIREAITDNVQQFLFTRQPKQFLDEENPKNVISEEVLTSIAVQSGAQSFDLLLELSGSPVQNYTLGNSELAVLDEVVFA